MAERNRHQEDRAMMKASQASGAGMKAGVMPHGFPMRPESSIVPTHPLAYGIMHQPQIARVNPSTRNDLGPPIFMPSLNLGVPRPSVAPPASKQSKNSLSQPMMPASYMSEVMAYPPQPIMFHPSQVRPGTQGFITSSSGSKAVSSKPQSVVRPTPKQPTSLPLASKPASTVSRPRGESPVEQFVHSPPGGPYLLPHQLVSGAKAGTLSKMLMSPAQQSGVVSCSGQQLGGAYVSHNTTLRTAVPTLTSIATSAGKGSYSSAAPDGCHGQQSVTTSGQSTATASFTDTKTERPPQPSASNSPSPQGPGKDKSNIIIKGSGLTGRHIAAITNTTLQPGSGTPAYTSNNQASLQTVHSAQPESSPPDTGWPEPSSVSQARLGSPVSVPTVTAPGLVGLSTQTHSPGGAGSPGRHTHPPGLASSPRPHILRKRPMDNNQLTPGEAVPVSPSAEALSHNHLSSRLEAPELTVSPRKKPRKQNMVANDDLYASNVPDSLSSSSASSLEAPLSVEGSEESSRSSSTRSSWRSEQPSNSTPGELEIKYLSQLRKSPYPISSHHRAYHKAPHNHFKQHSDIKHREELRVSAVQLGSDDCSQLRAAGWRMHHALSQINEMSKIEQELLEVTEELQCLTSDMRGQDCAVRPDCVASLSELLECIAVRASRILSHMTETRDKSKQMLEHSGLVSELLSKCRAPSQLLTNHSKPRS